MIRTAVLGALLLIFSSISIILISTSLDLAEERLVLIDIPDNNSQTLGVQKYNFPPQNLGQLPPNSSARAILIKDLTSDSILYQKDAEVRVPIASTTKIATALVASAHFKPNSILVVGDSADIDGSSVGLQNGERLSFRSLLYGMLLNSGNDAAFTIAENYPGGVSAFVSAMNEEGKRMGLYNTNFQNPAGFDSPNHFSSATDLAKITQEAIKDSQLARIFATKSTEVASIDKRFTHKLTNLNKLLSSVTGVLGVKTGYTQAAKENLVTLVERDNHKVLLVVLGSNDRFGETINLIDWVFKNYRWIN